MTFLEDDVGEYRMELQVDQIAPPFRVASAAFLPIRDGCEVEVACAIDEMSEALQNCLHVRDAATLKSAWYVGLPDRGAFVEVGHASDRSYAGYGNLYRAIASLARWLGDARFFISESYSSWIDHYRISDGVLAVERGEAGDDTMTEKHAYFAAQARAGDAELRAFVAWELSHSAGYAIPERADYKPEKIKRALSSLKTASELDPDNFEVLWQSGRAARAQNKDAKAADLFARAIEVGSPKLPDLRTTMAATAIAAGRDDDARTWLAAARPSQASFILRAHLGEDGATAAALACTEIGEREAIPWTRAHEPLVLAHARRVSELAWTDAVPRIAAATDLYAWAELYRIRKAHDVDVEQSLRVARALFDAAAALDPLGGDIAAHRVFLDHGMQSSEAVDAFLAVLAEFPAQGDALFWAASGLHKRQDWTGAAAIGRRYIAVGTTRSGYERNAAKAVLADSLLRAAYERMTRGDLGDETERLIADATSLADPHGSWVGPEVGIADLHELRREHAKALPMYDAALAKNPDSVHAWSGKASCLSNLERFSEALTCVETALENDDAYWHAHYVKACILARTGGDRAAIIALARHALSLDGARREQIIDEPDLAAVRDALTT